MGKAYGVAVGWFATVIAAVAVGEWSVPDAPSVECQMGCLDITGVAKAIACMLAFPALVVLSAVTAVVARWRLPAVVTGTLSALAMTVLVVVLAALTLMAA